MVATISLSTSSLETVTPTLSWLRCFFILGLYITNRNIRNIRLDNAPNNVPIVPPAAPYLALSNSFAANLTSITAATMLTMALIICSASCETAVGIIVFLL